MSPLRRTVLRGCVGALASLLTGWAYAETECSRPPLVLLSLRGGWDALNLLIPLEGHDRAAYEAARPTLQVPAAHCLPVGNGLGMHPAARPLHELMSQGKLALVCAAGLGYDTRSHFDASEFMDDATPGDKTTMTGWMGRYLRGLAQQSPFPAVALGAPSDALLGARAITVGRLDDLKSPGHGSSLQLLDDWYSGSSWLSAAGRNALEAARLIERQAALTPRRGRGYPPTDFGRALQEAARVLKLGLGVRVVSLELGGWDTHDHQHVRFARRLAELGQGLTAFQADMGKRPFNLVAQSEFGRRLAENASGGTDHGHANAMLVMGCAIRAGLHGNWPGLGPEQLYQHEDLAVTTDYRHVLADLLPAEANLDEIFPGLGPRTIDPITTNRR